MSRLSSDNSKILDTIKNICYKVNAIVAGEMEATMASFTGLQERAASEDGGVTAGEVVATLEEYAASGSAISSGVVTELLERVGVELTAELLGRAEQAALKGARDQRAEWQLDRLDGHIRYAQHYEAVVEFVCKRLKTFP